MGTLELKNGWQKKWFLSGLVASAMMSGCGGGSGPSTTATDAYAGLSYSSSNLSLGTNGTGSLTMAVGKSGGISGSLTVTSSNAAFRAPTIYTFVTSFTGTTAMFNAALNGGNGGTISGTLPVAPSTAGGTITLTIGTTSYGPFNFSPSLGTLAISEHNSGSATPTQLAAGSDGNIYYISSTTSSNLANVPVLYEIMSTGTPIVNAVTAPIVSIANTPTGIWEVDNQNNLQFWLFASGIIFSSSSGTSGFPGPMAYQPSSKLLAITSQAGGSINFYNSGGGLDHTIKSGQIPSGATCEIVASDSSIWTSYSNGSISNVSSSGAIAGIYSFSQLGGNSVTSLAQGPDGNIWFTCPGADVIGNVSSSGTLSIVPIPTLKAAPYGITVGADKNLWFTENQANQIGRYVIGSKTITEYAVPTANSGPYGITSASDGMVWFGENTAEKLGSFDPKAAH